MKRILVVEDDSEMLRSISSILEAEGYRVDGALDAHQAIGHYRRHRYDLLLLDLILPEKDGLELLKDIGESDVAAVPPVIALSGGSADLPGQYALSGALSYGALDVLHKPFSRNELIEKIAQALS